jgi:hypothetical protein
MKTKTQTTAAALKRRIRQFYKLLNAGDFARCHQMIDPCVRLKPSSVTLLQFENSLRQFLDHFGAVTIQAINVDLHVGERNKLYENRDFALGQTIWQDESGVEHVFSERWVREDQSWYTRSTGFVVPNVVARAERSPRNDHTPVLRSKRRA